MHYYALHLCYVFMLTKNVLFSSWAEDVLCFCDSETKIVKLPQTLNQDSL